MANNGCTFFRSVQNLRRPNFPVTRITTSNDDIVAGRPNAKNTIAINAIATRLLCRVNSPTCTGPSIATHFSAVRLARAKPSQIRVDKIINRTPPPQLGITTACLNKFHGDVALIVAKHSTRTGTSLTLHAVTNIYLSSVTDTSLTRHSALPMHSLRIT